MMERERALAAKELEKTAEAQRLKKKRQALEVERQMRENEIAREMELARMAEVCLRKYQELRGEGKRNACIKHFLHWQLAGRGQRTISVLFLPSQIYLFAVNKIWTAVSKAINVCLFSHDPVVTGKFRDDA